MLSRAISRIGITDIREVWQSVTDKNWQKCIWKTNAIFWARKRLDFSGFYWRESERRTLSQDGCYMGWESRPRWRGLHKASGRCVTAFRLRGHTGQNEHIMWLACAAVWAIWSNCGTYGDPQIMSISRFQRGNLKKSVILEFWKKSCWDSWTSQNTVPYHYSIYKMIPFKHKSRWSKGSDRDEILLAIYHLWFGTRHVHSFLLFWI